MDQMASDPGRLNGESSRGDGSVLYSINYFSITEKSRVRIAPRPPSSEKNPPVSFREVLHEG